METEAENDPDFEKTKKLLENPEEDKDDEDLDELVDEIDKKKAKVMSKEFNIFLDATKSNPSQVIRYCPQGMIPLWSSKKYRLKTNAVPKCEN